MGGEGEGSEGDGEGGEGERAERGGEEGEVVPSLRYYYTSLVIFRSSLEDRVDFKVIANKFAEMERDLKSFPWLTELLAEVATVPKGQLAALEKKIAMSQELANMSSGGSKGKK